MQPCKDALEKNEMNSLKEQVAVLHEKMRNQGIDDHYKDSPDFYDQTQRLGNDL